MTHGSPGSKILIIGAGLILAVVVLARGFDRTLSVATGALFFGLLAYGAYLQLATALFRGEVPTVEGSRLVQRDKRGRERKSIDLSVPFQRELLHYDGINASYRVRQGRNRLQFSISAGSDGRFVREVLHLSWPPATTPASQWTP